MHVIIFVNGLTRSTLNSSIIGEWTTCSLTKKEKKKKRKKWTFLSRAISPGDGYLFTHHSDWSVVLHFFPSVSKCFQFIAIILNKYVCNSISTKLVVHSSLVMHYYISKVNEWNYVKQFYIYRAKQIPWQTKRKQFWPWMNLILQVQLIFGFSSSWLSVKPTDSSW